MQKSKKARSQVRRNTSRRNFLRIERLEDRMVLTGAAPIAANDTYQLLPDQTLDVSAPGILANDTDAEGDALTAALFSGPAHGTLTLDPAGSLHYTPTTGFAGIDSFMYSAQDGTGHSQLAAVTLRVGNTPPGAQNDSYTLNEDETLTIPAAGVLGNDSDPDGDPLTAALVSGPLHGSLSLNPDGSFSYIPEANFHGLDGFSYMVQDASAQSSVATVTLEVISVNDTPVAVNDDYTTDEDAALSVNAANGLLGNDTDADGDSLTASLVGGPSHGTLTLNADGSFDYTPDANFSGVDGFSYVVNDGTTNSDVASVTLNVAPINDGPTAVNDEYTTDEDTAITIDATAGLLTNDTDPDSTSLTPSLVSGPMHGELTLNPDGSFTYTPSANFNGVDGFSYSVSDGLLDSDVATVTLNVNSVPDAPLAVNDAFTTDEDTPLVIGATGVLANDSDADGDSLTAALVSGPAHGTLTLNADGSLSYTPEANFNGEDSFVYTASDGSLTGQATVAITVNPVNDAPTAAADEFSTDEDTSLHVDASGVLANDSDPEGETLTAALVSGPASGTLTLNADGSFDYVPGANFNGDDTFVYTASDGVAASAETTVTIHVQTVNDAPVAIADAYSTDEDAPLVVDVAGSVLANDSDVDGDSLTAALVTGPAHGTLTLNSDGSFNYTPEANFNGSDSFVYQASDGTLTSSDTTVTITVNPLNDAPLTVADEFTTDEDTSLHVDPSGVLANDSDPDGDTLTAALVTGPVNGTLTLNADGSFDYVPGANFNGDDSFIYTASDGTSSSSETTVAIHVQAVNDAPIAVGDSYSTDEDTPLTIDVPGVLANDSDVDGDSLTAALVTGPAHGTLTLNADGSFNYAPEADFSGTDLFVYTASDGALSSNEATVCITVNPTNDAPLAAADEFSTDEDTSLHVDPAGILGNDSDPDGDTLTAALVTGPANGTLTLNADGSFDYAPGADFNGDDSFVYTANDGGTASAETTVTIHVQAVNDAPVAAADSYTTDEDTPLVVDVAGSVLANDSDADGDGLTAALVTGPAHGTLTLNSDGSFNYAPEANFSGSDSFVYTASDGSLASIEATVSITVNPASDAPLAVADEFSTDEDTSLHVDPAGILGNDSDPDGDALSAVLVSGPSSGTLSLNADGSFDYTPGADFNGDDSFVYTANDGVGASAETTVTIHVQAVNDAPVAAADAYTTDEDTPLTISAPGVLANDSDIDGDSLSAILVNGPAHGTVSLAADGSLTYTPEANFNGSDSFTYQANDGTLTSGETTVSITVNSVADAPLPYNDAYSTGEDVTLTTSVEMGVLANDFDPQDLPLTAILVSGPANGALALNPDGSFSYTPAANYHGTDSFTYVANNGVEDGPLMTASIVVQPLNDAPAAVNDDYTADVGGNVSTTAADGVLANDTDIDGDSLAATLLWGPSHGTLTLGTDGSFSYAATAGYSGTDTFKYQVNDGLANSNVATVTLHIGSPEVGDNAAPESADDSFEVDAGSTLTVNAPGVLGNDTDADDDVLAATLVSGPSNGVLTLNADGSFDYTPDDSFIGMDSFTYAASDGKESGNTATVSISVNDPIQNHNPVAKDDGYVVDAETLLSIPADQGVLANDTDADGNPLTAVLIGGAAHGTVALNPDGSFDYQPEVGFTGTDSFTYQASDGAGLSEVAIVDVMVGSAANHRPVAVNDRYTTTVDQPLTVAAPGLLGNDSDPDGDPQTAELFNGPQNGTVVLNSDGSFVYTPAAGFQGRDSFIYRTFDGEVHSALAAATIYVNPAPSVPGIVGGGDETPHGCLLGGAIRSVLHHLELARHGIDEELLDSLAQDHHHGFRGHLNSWLHEGRWL